MAVVFGLNPVQLKLRIRMPVTPDSGWLMQNLLGLVVLASGWLAIARGWLTSVLLALFVIASRWFPRILLVFFAVCYSQWMAYVAFVGIFCYSQCVVCTDPLTLGVLSVGALRSSFCFVLVLFRVLLVLPVGGLGVASRAFTQFCCCSYFSRCRPLGWAALALQRAAPNVCVLSCGVYWDLEESSYMKYIRG